MLYIRNDKADLVCPEEILLSNPIEIKVQSVGNTKLNINAPAIRLLCQAVGNISIKGKCGSITIKNQSEGDLNAMGLIAEVLSIKNMAEGNIELFAEREITISHFGEGSVYYAGPAVLKDVKQYGSGKIGHLQIKDQATLKMSPDKYC